MILLDFLNAFVYSIDTALSTKRKRHIMGGVLLSASLLFGGLAATVFTLKTDPDMEGYDE